MEEKELMNEVNEEELEATEDNLEWIEVDDGAESDDALKMALIGGSAIAGALGLIAIVKKAKKKKAAKAEAETEEKQTFGSKLKDSKAALKSIWKKTEETDGTDYESDVELEDSENESEPEKKTK